MKARISYSTGDPKPVIVSNPKECRTQDERDAFEILRALDYQAIQFGTMLIEGVR